MTGTPIVAAGGAVWRGSGTQREVLLVHRPRYDDWSLPKGKLSRGEHILAGAVREIHEETGYRVTLGPPLGVQRYSVRRQDAEVPKSAHYWAASPVSPDSDFAPNDEVDRMEWLPIATARARLSYPRDVEILDALDGVLPVVASVVLLRHTEAVEREDWDGDDALRPLSPGGVREAESLVDVLAALGVGRILTSDAERCLAAVRPYASAAGVPLGECHEISENGYTRDPSGLAGLARTVWAPGHVTLVCSHRPVLPALARELGLRPGRFSPGAFLVAHRLGSGPPLTERFGVP